MALILHIDTALEKAFVGLAQNGKLLMGIENDVQHDHAAFVQPAIKQMLYELHISLNDINAVGITRGPGSYTGLRVGMASAKGICYALNKPLIAISTLEVMTTAAIEASPEFDIYCPMIDARRNEVFTALYNRELEQIQKPQAIMLFPGSFTEQLQKNNILFFGSGASKWKLLNATSENASFETVEYNSEHIAKILFNSFKNSQFCDLAYTDPWYIKDFHFASTKKPL